MESNPVDPAVSQSTEPNPEPLLPPAREWSVEASSQPPAAAVSSVPEDLRVPWGGLDVLLLLFFGFGAFVIVAMGLQFALALLLPAVGAATHTKVFPIALQVAWSLVMLAFLALQMRVRFRAPFWRTIGFRAFRSGELTARATYLCTVLGGALLAIGVQIASVMLDRFVPRPEALPIEALFQSRPSAILMMVSAIAVAPLVEEVMFRGFLYPVIARRLGVSLGVLITGALFGLMHAGQLWGGWGQIGLLMGVGVVMTYVRARTGSVLASYLLHLGYNALLLLGFFIATSGLKNLPVPR